MSDTKKLNLTGEENYAYFNGAEVIGQADGVILKSGQSAVFIPYEDVVTIVNLMKEMNGAGESPSAGTQGDSSFGEYKKDSPLEFNPERHMATQVKRDKPSCCEKPN